MNLSQYIGIPFEARGRTFDACDCWGLVTLFYKHEMQIDLPSYTDSYVDGADFKNILGVISTETKNWLRIAQNAVKLGDVILFRTTAGAHVGIYIEDQKMLHTSSGKDSCIEKISSPLWNSRIIGCFRYNG